MTLLTQMAADLTVILGALPLTFSIGSTSYSGSKTVLKKELEYTDYGAGNNYQFSVITAASNFVTPPAIGSKITISSVAYRVLAASSDAAGVSLRIDLGEEFQ